MKHFVPSPPSVGQQPQPAFSPITSYVIQGPPPPGPMLQHELAGADGKTYQFWLPRDEDSTAMAAWMCWEAYTVGPKTPRLPPANRTKRGDLVRSRAECSIADTLYGYRVGYTYEPAFYAFGKLLRPDFVVPHRYGELLIEYLGIEDPGYLYSFDHKHRFYRYAGVVDYVLGARAPRMLLILRNPQGVAFDSGFLDYTIMSALMDIGYWGSPS